LMLSRAALLLLLLLHKQALKLSMPSSSSIISNNSSLQYSCRPSSLVSITSYPSGCGRCSGTHVNVLRSPTAEGILHPRSLTLVQRSYSRKTEQRDKKNQEKQKGFSIPTRVIIPTSLLGEIQLHIFCKCLPDSSNRVPYLRHPPSLAEYGRPTVNPPVQWEAQHCG
jgi:hypothetical protein